MADYYFMKSVKVRGEMKLRPLPGQYDNGGIPIDPSLNVQADRIMRNSYPTAVFGTDTLVIRTSSGASFYSAGQIYPMDLPPAEYQAPGHKPQQNMVDAYSEYKRKAAQMQDTDGGLFGKEDTEDSEDTETDAISGTLRLKIQTDSRYTAPTIENDGFYIDKANWTLLIRNILGKVNTMMIGPSGAGKTELVMLACRKLGLDCSVYDMGSMYDPVAGLLGVHRLQKGGESVFDYAKFTQDIQKPGVVLLDELSRAPVTTNNILFPCLDSRRMLPVEMAGGDGMRAVKVHPECVFVATANVGVEYTGTMSMDRALVGRFFPLELGYIPDIEETKVLVKRYGIGRSDAANIVAVAQTVRSLYNKQELSCTISTRETLAASALVADGWSTEEAMELTFLPLFEGTKADGERSVVYKSFLTR